MCLHGTGVKRLRPHLGTVGRERRSVGSFRDAKSIRASKRTPFASVASPPDASSSIVMPPWLCVERDRPTLSGYLSQGLGSGWLLPLWCVRGKDPPHRPLRQREVLPENPGYGLEATGQNACPLLARYLRRYTPISEAGLLRCFLPGDFPPGLPPTTVSGGSARAGFGIGCSLSYAQQNTEGWVEEKSTALRPLSIPRPLKPPERTTGSLGTTPRRTSRADSVNCR